ncbi:MAG: hypothetical protein FGM57_02935 [Candidatus Taylorbacteria bacterium]|nr:hypothetical protein [Candidatus Taylorbacteria bacterium]
MCYIFCLQTRLFGMLTQHTLNPVTLMVPSTTDFLILGAPGSGKTTQGRLLAANLRSDHMFIDMSRVCKVAGKFLPGFGNAFAEYSGKGELVPDELILPNFRTYMETVDPGVHIVGSGLFRNPNQVHWVYDHVPFFRDGGSPLSVIRIKLSPDDAVRRCRKRAELARAAGLTPRATDLDDALNRGRVKTYDDFVEPVIEALCRRHPDIRLLEAPSQDDPHDTFSGILSAVGAKPEDCYLRLVA